MNEALFDHLVYAAPELHAANQMLGNALGITPDYGGEHAADYGTCNSLLSLGPGCYLEVLAPVEAEGRQRPPFGAGVAALAEGDVITFAIASSDLPGVAGRARAVGLGVREGTANSRVTPQGLTLRWRGLYLDHDIYRGLVPFCIDWMDSTHPSLTAPAGAVVHEAFVTHPQPEGLRRIYATLGLRIEVRAGNRTSIVVGLEHGTQRFTLMGTGRGLGL